jgi:hypothetical protein
MRTTFEVGIGLPPNFIEFISKKAYNFYDERDIEVEKDDFEIIEALIKMGILREEMSITLEAHVCFTLMGLKIKSLIEEDKKNGNKSNT